MNSVKATANKATPTPSRAPDTSGEGVETTGELWGNPRVFLMTSFERPQGSPVTRHEGFPNCFGSSNLVIRPARPYCAAIKQSNDSERKGTLLGNQEGEQRLQCRYEVLPNDNTAYRNTRQRVAVTWPLAMSMRDSTKSDERLVRLLNHSFGTVVDIEDGLIAHSALIATDGQAALPVNYSSKPSSVGQHHPFYYTIPQGF